MTREVVLAIVGFTAMGAMAVWFGFFDGLATIDCAVGIESRCR